MYNICTTYDSESKDSVMLERTFTIIRILNFVINTFVNIIICCLITEAHTIILFDFDSLFKKKLIQ